MPQHNTRRPAASPSGMTLVCELIVMATACLAPWAFGSVDAWAELGLVICVTLLAVFSAINGWRSAHSFRLLNTPGLAIAGLALLAWFQTVSLPATIYRWLDAPGFALRNELVPTATPQRVRGDDGPPVAAPSLTLSQDRDATIRPAIQLTAAFILFQSIVSLGGGYSALRRFGLAVTVNASALALFALVQALAWKGMIYGIRPSPIPHAWYSGGPFVSYHHLAAYLNFGLGFALAFVLGGGLNAPARSWEGEPPVEPRCKPARTDFGELSRAEPRPPVNTQSRFAVSARTADRFQRPGRHRIPPLALYATALIAVGVIGSHSRGGFLAMAIAAIALVLVFRREPLRIWVGMAFILVIAALLLFAVGSTSPLERLSTIWQTSLTGFNGRSQIWTAGLQAWLANPVWGVGLGCFPEGAAPFYQFEREALYFHAENDYLEVLAEGGLLGFGLGVLAFASIARFASRAFACAPTTADRTIVMGGLFGLLALAVKSSADFPLHIPGVAVTGLVICAYLCRIGLDARQNESAADTGSDRAPGMRAPMAMTALAVLCVPLLWLSFQLTRTELALLRANIPLPGTQWLTTDYGRLPIGELEKIEVTLEKILQDRPDWTDGHLRLGMMYLSQYEQTTMEWAVAAGQNPSTALILAEPLWLHGLIHSEARSEAEINTLIEEDPIWLYLIPAARCFVEARRCCPVRSLPHAWLASLDFLIEGGETTSAHVRRALRQSGNDKRVMAVSARAAVQVGDLELASLCWRKSLEINPSTADDIAPLASSVLTAEQILDRVLPVSGTLVIRFADLLYPGLASKQARDLFLKEAIKRADGDPHLTPSERLWCTAQAWARLEQADLARKQMEAALAVEPKREPWRNEYVDWLIRWGDTEEALNQATIGVNLVPSHQGPQNALDRAAEARSRSRLETKAQL